MANHLCWFEVSSTDPEKAREFYSSLFGWKAKKARTNYYQMTTGRVPHGGLIKKLPLVPNTGVYVYIHVASIEKTLAKVKKLGGRLLVAQDGDSGLWLLCLSCRPGRQPDRRVQREVDCRCRRLNACGSTGQSVILATMAIEKKRLKSQDQTRFRPDADL